MEDVDWGVDGGVSEIAGVGVNEIIDERIYRRVSETVQGMVGDIVYKRFDGKCDTKLKDKDYGNVT